MTPGSEDVLQSSDSRNSVFESESSYYSDDDDDDDDDHVPFFADATLDLEEAQGIAATPDPHVKSLTGAAQISGLEVPNLLDQSSAEASGGVGVVVVSGNANANGNGNVPPPPAMIIKNRSVSIGDADESSSSISSRTGRNASTYTVHAIHGGAPNAGNDNDIGNGTTRTGSTFNINNQPVYRPRPPHRPRDTKWTTSFLVSLPFLFLPRLLSPNANADDADTNTNTSIHHQIHRADIYIIFTLGISVLLARVFYLSRGGGEGDDRRHTAGQILLVANIASCGILPLVTISFYNLHISGGFYAFILLGLAYWTIRDIFFAAKLFQSGRYIVEGVNDGQRAFFRMLVNASLDILSRSFRCQSFYRVIVILLTLQLGILLGLRKALEYAIAMPYPFHFWWVLFVGVIGYWCVNVVIRVLGYLACGGVTAWFAQQGALIEDIERMRRREEGDDFDEDELDSTEVNANTMMPEAYRNVDSSAYSMGIEFDEGMDDDFGDDAPTISSITGMNGRNASASSGENDSRYASTGTGTGTGTTFRSDGGGNVKSFCKSAIGISFGSIVHCAIAGGVANIAWDFLRTVEWIASLSSRFAPLRPGNFRGMTVGGDFSDGNLRDRLIAKWQRLISASRAFVRNRNDLALCHVAAYYKGYTRAANDVMTVIDVSGK